MSEDIVDMELFAEHAAPGDVLVMSGLRTKISEVQVDTLSSEVKIKLAGQEFWREYLFDDSLCIERPFYAIENFFNLKITLSQQPRLRGYVSLRPTLSAPTLQKGIRCTCIGAVGDNYKFKETANKLEISMRKEYLPYFDLAFEASIATRLQTKMLF